MSPSQAANFSATLDLQHSPALAFFLTLPKGMNDLEGGKVTGDENSFSASLRRLKTSLRSLKTSKNPQRGFFKLVL
jgi:hypothetical protein